MGLFQQRNRLLAGVPRHDGRPALAAILVALGRGRHQRSNVLQTQVRLWTLQARPPSLKQRNCSSAFASSP